ncbi:hypothetical protein WN51_07818 [Melipona quadrifasciata]|uniref:Uncharacterized protein n=1 Tax=Melipona quadrifasciata TaxID=166423 RepID=A0A0N0BIZ3_9HYME|nr:hypothetical protein WN51_07818 [Melipona quadrifasciata]
MQHYWWQNVLSEKQTSELESAQERQEIQRKAFLFAALSITGEFDCKKYETSNKATNTKFNMN